MKLMGTFDVAGHILLFRSQFLTSRGTTPAGGKLKADEPRWPQSCRAATSGDLISAGQNFSAKARRLFSSARRAWHQFS